jgi:hypothetical protein
LRTSNEKVAALTGDKKPWLFCDSTWLEETETVYEDDGSILLGENGQDPPTIRNLVLDDDNREFFDVYQTPAGNTNPDNCKALSSERYNVTAYSHPRGCLCILVFGYPRLLCRRQKWEIRAGHDATWKST